MQYTFYEQSNNKSEIKNNAIVQAFLVNNQTIICLCVSGFFSFIFIIYSFAFVYYITVNLYKKKGKFYAYWLDLGGSALLIVLFSITFLIRMIIVGDGDRNNLNWNKQANESTSSTVLYLELMSIMILIEYNIFFDILNFVRFFHKVTKVAKMKPKDVNDMRRLFEEVNISSLVGQENHLYELLGSTIFFFASTFYFLYSFLINNPKEGEFFCSISLGVPEKIYCYLWFFLTIFRILQIIDLTLLFIMMIFTKSFKSKILEKKNNFKNLIMQKIYNTNTSQLASFCDFITFKSISDFLSNVPLLLFFALGRLFTYPLILSYIAMLFHIILSGALFLHMYKKHSEIPKYIRILFLVDHFAFRFGVKEQQRTFNEFEFRVTENEYNAINEMKNLAIIDVDTSEEDSFFANEIPSYSNKNDNFNLNTESDYFVLFKLIYYYYEKNKKIYRETERKMEEEGAPFKMLQNFFPSGQKDAKSKSNWRGSKFASEYIEKINRISRLSQMHQKNVVPSYKIISSQLFKSIEEKEYLQEFKKNYKVYNFNSVEFTIEALYNDIFYQLFPFYQINIDDLIKSLNPSRNKHLFKKFVQCQDDKNDNYQQESPLMFSKSVFSSYDSFLLFETFEKSEYQFNEHYKFLLNYKDYIFEVVKNLNYTYLPLFLGVFSISFKNKYKIVVLYRHPLSLSMQINFNHWLSYEVTEGIEKIRTSANNSELLNFNEIEVKNNIVMEREEYEEMERTLVNDFKFINEKSTMKLFPIINLFIGNEILMGQSEEVKNNMSFINSSQASEENKSFNSLLKETNLIGENVPKKKNVKEKGSKFVSLLEKELYIYKGVNRYTINIYFSNFFRRNCDLNEKEKNLALHLDSQGYCEFIQNQLLSYFTMSKDIFIPDLNSSS